MSDKVIPYLDERALNRVAGTVLWSERQQRLKRAKPPLRSVPIAKNQQAFAICQADIEHKEFGDVELASGASYDATLAPVIGGDTLSVYNPGPKLWNGATVEIQQGALAGATTGEGQKRTVLKAWSATRIRGLADADIGPGQIGTLNTVVGIDGFYPLTTASVFMPTQFVSAHAGLQVWAELRYDETGAQSVWEIYSADCDPGGGGGGSNQLFPLDNGDVPWDVDVNGKVCTLVLTAVDSGNPIRLTRPAGVLDRDVFLLTVIQDDVGGHTLLYDLSDFFWPYGEPKMNENPTATELLSFTAVETASDIVMLGQMTPDLGGDRFQVDPTNLVNLSATNAAVVATGKGPTITDGANALDGSDATFCTLVKDTIVQNANQEWAVRIELANPVPLAELTAIGMANCSFTFGTRYPDVIKVYFYSDQFGAGDVVKAGDVDPVLFWQSGILVPANVLAPTRPYDGPFQSVEFWFRFTGRNLDIGDITFSRAVVTSRLPGWTGT